jgi:hypothetical protein
MQKKNLLTLSRIFLALMVMGYLVFASQAPVSAADHESTLLNVTRAQPIPGKPLLPTRLLVQMKATGPFGLNGKPSTSAIEGVLSDGASGTQAAFVNDATGYQVFKFNKNLSNAEFAAVINKLSQTPGVVSVLEDTPVYPDAVVPNDPYFTCLNTTVCSQTYNLSQLMNNLSTDANGLTSAYEGADVQRAWEITTGNPAVAIGVLDTGITNHPDLAGRWKGGYDFVSDPGLAGDGDGWDSSPLDTGYSSIYTVSGGRFHGSHVAGTIGAIANNGADVVGINWQSPIVPVRVLSWAGGYMSDINTGMLWQPASPSPVCPSTPIPCG